MKQYIMSIDQGTTSTRTIIFNSNGQVVSIAQQEIKVYYPKSDWVLQDPDEIFESVRLTMHQALIKANLSFEDIASIGITNQRETTVLWNKKTGEAIDRAIVWQSKQSASICDELKYKGLDTVVLDKTGLVIDPYFSATKIMWSLKHIDHALELMNQDDLAFGTIDSWLIYKLTNHMVHKTDVTNASRTMLYNIHTLSWDQELCELFGINQNILPTVHHSDHEFGQTSSKLTGGVSIKINAILGDQQAALYGHQCIHKGDIKNTYGTGCFMLMNIGEAAIISDKGLLTTIAYGINGTINYALEGSIFVAGSAIQWLRDELEFFENAEESEQLIASSKSDQVYVVPAFSGLGSPHWDKQARGAIFGITRSTNKADITKATLNSLAFQTKDLIRIMEEVGQISINDLRVDGGATSNHYLMQFQSNVLQSTVLVPKMKEMTAYGVGLLSAQNSGFEDFNQSLNGEIYEKLTPLMSETEANKLYDKWLTAVKATKVFK
jgi:glycerol kinase